MTKFERESINFKLPKPLAAALRKAARERKTTATDLVIQGLHRYSRTASHFRGCTRYRSQCRNSLVSA